MRFTPQMRAIPWLVARPIAHRGLHDGNATIVENSESAFAAAMARGYSIECDVQITADGEAVVFHDATLDRVIDARGQVRARTISELRKLAFRAGKDRLQSLHDVLEQVGGRVPLIVELKSDWDGADALVKRTLDTLADYRGPHGLMSFDPDQIEAVAILSPDSVRGVVADRAIDALYRTLPFARRLELRGFTHLTRTKPHFISYFSAHLPFEPVSQIRAAGFPVISYTIRSAAAGAAALRYSDQITFEGYLA